MIVACCPCIFFWLCVKRPSQDGRLRALITHLDGVLRHLFGAQNDSLRPSISVRNALIGTDSQHVYFEPSQAAQVSFRSTAQASSTCSSTHCQLATSTSLVACCLRPMDARDEQRSTDDREPVGAQFTSMPSSVATEGAVGNGAAVAAPPACAVEGETSKRSEVDQASHPLAVPEAPRPASVPLDDNEGPSSEPLRSIRLADLTSRHDADDQDAIARAAVAANSAPAGATGVQQPVQVAGRNEAVAVRRHLIRAAWKGFSSLTRGRKWIFIFKLLISLAQVRRPLNYFFVEVLLS